MHIKNRVRYLSVALVGGLLQTACSDTEETFADQPVEALYNQAMDALQAGSYTRAAQAFVEVERQHPYSSLSPKSLLMAAYSYYQAKKYEDALENYNVFIQLHPGHEHIDYAYYMVGICYYEQIPMVERDQRVTEDALRAFEDVVQRFPSTPFAKDATLKIDLIRDHLAGKEMEVGRYYLDRQAYLAALNRFKNVVEGFQTTSHAPEALHRMVECYLALGIMDQAQRTAAVLGYNYPGSAWYADTYDLIRQAMPDALKAAPKPVKELNKGAEKPKQVLGAPSDLTASPVPVGKTKLKQKPAAS